MTPDEQAQVVRLALSVQAAGKAMQELATAMLLQLKTPGQAAPAPGSIEAIAERKVFGTRSKRPDEQTPEGAATPGGSDAGA